MRLITALFRIPVTFLMTMTAYYVSLFVRNNLNFKEIDRECRVTLYELYKLTKLGQMLSTV